MSIFDYPRINFDGYIALNPGTANNDDYAQGNQVTMPKEYGKYAGQALGLIDSLLVEPITYGMDDATFIQWAQQAHKFDGSNSPIIPAEWNYYGPQTMGIDGTSNIHGNVTKASISGVQTGPLSDQIYSAPNPSVPISNLVGQSLTLSGHITDINSEGSPPATQFFIDSLGIGSLGQFSGFSKGVGQWLNFYRNINLVADGGAGGYVYHVLPKSQMGALSQYFSGDTLQGVIVRYYLYRPQLLGDNDTLQNSIYPNHETNAAPLQITGTIAPWFEGENITTVPVGRLLTSNVTNIPTPTGNNNGGGKIALAPAVLRVANRHICIDFLGTFPECYQDMQTNNKWNFGDVSLWITDGGTPVKITDITYADTAAGNVTGWVYDIDISENQKVLEMLAGSASDSASFYLQWNDPDNGPTTVLSEVEYNIVSNQSAVYGEQKGSNVEFNNQGTPEMITISVYRRGRELSAAESPSISAWSYFTNPIQSPGNAQLLTSNLRPGAPVMLPTDRPGNFLITFAVNPPSGGYPPPSYNTFMMPPYVTNAPSISVRILPNNVDFSKYYDDLNDPENSANELLTFDVVYQHALRTYYLLYPAMNYKGFQLNDCKAVAKNASRILSVTDQANWMSISYMPRTRDLSDSRRTLLRAWCRRVLKLKAQGIDPC